jgi:hypothetical protein
MKPVQFSLAVADAQLIFGAYVLLGPTWAAVASVGCGAIAYLVVMVGRR